MLIGDEEGEGACMFFSPPIALAKPPPSFPSSSSASSSPTPTSTRSLSLEALSSLLDHEHVLTVNMVRDSWRTLMVLSADRTIYEGYWRHLHQMALRILSWLDGSRLEELLPTWIQQSEGSSIHNWHDAHPLLVLDLITLLGDTVPGQVAAIIILDAALISLPLKRGQGEGKLTPVFLGSDQAFLQWLTRQYLFLSGGLADLCLLYRLTLLANARLHRTPLTGCRGDLGSLLTALVRLKASLPRATPALTLLSIRTREALGHMETLLRTLTSRTSVIEELTGGH